MDQGIFVIFTLQKLFEAISNDDNQTVFNLLYQLGMQHMLVSDADKFLKRILTHCADTQYNNSGMIEILISYCKRDNEVDLSPISRLFLDESIDDNVLRYTILHYRHSTYFDIMSEYVRYDRDFNLILTYERIHEVFGEQEDNGIYYSIMNDAQEQDNQVVIAYIGGLLGRISEPIEAPKWIGNFTGYDDLPNEEDIVLPYYFHDLSMPSHDVMLDLLMEGIDISDPTYEELKSHNSMIINIATVKDRKEMIRPYLENKIINNRYNDITLFRIYGPCNPVLESGISLDTPLSEFRMLTDNTFNSIDYSTGTIIRNPDWFLGYCQQCFQKIKKRCYAIRIPRVYGGFIGCFCSKRCILKNDDYFDIEKDEPTEIQLNMIELLEQELLEYGIQDRNE